LEQSIKKHLLLIFHSKAKILIKKIIEQSKTKLALGKTFKKKTNGKYYRKRKKGKKTSENKIGKKN
jgi:hypothetical protein